MVLHIIRADILRVDIFGYNLYIKTKKIKKNTIHKVPTIDGIDELPDFNILLANFIENCIICCRRKKREDRHVRTQDSSTEFEGLLRSIGDFRAH